MRRKPREQPGEDFQMAPMIDMVFLLLVFFMTVSTIAQADRRIELDLPDSAEAEVSRDLADRGTVSIDAEGTIYLAAQEVSLDTMKESIRGALQQTPELRIVVRADAETAYRDVKRVLRACAEAGAYDVIYATYQQR